MYFKLYIVASPYLRIVFLYVPELGPVLFDFHRSSDNDKQLEWPGWVSISEKSFLFHLVETSHEAIHGS